MVNRVGGLAAASAVAVLLVGAPAWAGGRDVGARAGSAAGHAAGWFVDASPPRVRLTGAGATVTATSGPRSVVLRGARDTVRLTARGADWGSAVTAVDLWVTFGYTCRAPDGGLVGASGTSTEPTASSAGDPIRYTVDIRADAGCPEAFPTLVAADVTATAGAVSAGGRTRSADLIITWRP